MRTTFFTSANFAYEAFALPYVCSTLFFNNDARVEICLEKPRRFEISNADAVDIMRQHFGERFTFRRGAFDGVAPNSVRFLEYPTIMTDFVYIGDIDILILEPVTDVHLETMANTGLPYSNVLRPTGKRLSGLHFTRSAVHYPLVLPTDAKRLGDEALLYSLLEAKGLPLPSPANTFRPQHGYHFSVNRIPHPSGTGWGLHKKYLHAYLELCRSEVWNELSHLFDTYYQVCLALTDAMLNALYPDDFAVPVNLPLRSVFDNCVKQRARSLF